MIPASYYCENYCSTTHSPLKSVWSYWLEVVEKVHVDCSTHTWLHLTDLVIILSLLIADLSLLATPLGARLPCLLLRPHTAQHTPTQQGYVLHWNQTDKHAQLYPQVLLWSTLAEMIYHYLFSWLIFHAHFPHIMVGGKPGRAPWKVIKICRLKTDLPKYGERGHQHELDMSSQWPQGQEAPGFLHCAGMLKTSVRYMSLLMESLKKLIRHLMIQCFPKGCKVVGQ